MAIFNKYRSNTKFKQRQLAVPEVLCNPLGASFALALSLMLASPPLVLAAGPDTDPAGLRGPIDTPALRQSAPVPVFDTSATAPGSNTISNTAGASPTTGASTTTGSSSTADSPISGAPATASGSTPGGAATFPPLGAGLPPDASSETDPNHVMIGQPPLSALVSISDNVDPFLLEATGNRQMTLPDVAKTALDTNLDIGISGMDERIRRTTFWSGMGKFLPDMTMSYNYNFLKGKANVPFGESLDALRFDNPLIITSAGFKYFGYRGGSVLFGALQSRNNLKAARHAKHATINDTLQEAVRLYYDLLLQEAFLQIRVQAVETSQTQLQLSRDLKTGGMGTQLEVLQAETQLSQDRQRLIDQQVARREASIKIAEFLNLPQTIDVSPSIKYLQKIRLVSEKLSVAQLLSAAIDVRPELKQYEELRLAAKKQIIINAARLQPTFAFTGNVFGIGETLGQSYENVSSMAPITLATAATAVGASGSGNLTQRLRSRQITSLFTIGYQLNWNLEGMGTVDALKVHAAKLEARKAQLQQVKVLNQVTSEVRRSYINTLKTERKIDEAISQVRSATEELKLAQLRYQNGLGKNIDVLRAQQDYTSSLIEKAQAIVNFNVAQVEMLRDAGLMSYTTVTAQTPLTKL